MKDAPETRQPLSMGWTTWLLLVALYVSFAFNIVAAPYFWAQSTHQQQLPNRGNGSEK